jgi:hypothetical protein
LTKIKEKEEIVNGVDIFGHEKVAKKYYKCSGNVKVTLIEISDTYMYILNEAELIESL